MAFGASLGLKADEIARQVGSIYGRPMLIDFLFPGSTWDDANDWTTGILRRERQYGYHWSEEGGATLKNEITRVLVVARALSPTVGYVTVNFHFSNKPECDEAAAKRGASAF